ncbi:DEAD/DEAH box helicase [Shimazuella alba]|uniref:DEAD/DEAH box helicase family protein n=1 Tax=Shimazuella alba TaxID=2690964 RepID=A0A6I4VYK2_9BACL|nr:DEAD/DEAH box helicase [Shimazuella alba]MXQ55010.1 DEAD/DEAH box helicase family protein [Shimazuella alba]
MELMLLWKNLFSLYNSSNDYIKEIVKTGHQLSRTGAVYNYNHDVNSILAMVADKSGNYEVKIQDSKYTCTCSVSSFCEHITATLFYAESMQKPGQSSELFKYWETVEKKSVPADNSENPLYSDRLKAVKKRKTSLKKTADLNCTLRPYQLDGAKWLIHLHKHKMGALLADDMGLGKTIQTIAFFNEIREKPKVSLIVVPTSLIVNWEKEFSHFAPNIKVHIHYGKERKKNSFKKDVTQYDIILTTYSTLVIDHTLFKSINWHIICLDEAQHIKNAQTKRANVIRSLNSEGRLALSGTPIENRLMELWSLTEFLNPKFLGTQAIFKQQYVQPIEHGHNKAKVHQLHQLIQPFILRRTKDEEKIKGGLPEKLEQKQYCTLTDEQEELYKRLVYEVKKEAKTLTKKKRKPYIMTMIGKLKQLCNHPGLYLKEGNITNVAERSNKVALVEELISNIMEAGESVILFTQYVQMGEVLQHYLTEKFKVNVLFLNGSTPQKERAKMVEDFQSKQAPIFILSLKAGGTGLNLTAANHVIHFDRWWNPAVENQATDRVHRIGQENFVQVHKLITVNTIEEKIDNVISQKQELSDFMLSPSSTNSIFDEDIDNLI